MTKRGLVNRPTKTTFSSIDNKARKGSTKSIQTKRRTPHVFVLLVGAQILVVPSPPVEWGFFQHIQRHKCVAWKKWQTSLQSRQWKEVVVAQIQSSINVTLNCKSMQNQWYRDEHSILEWCIKFLRKRINHCNKIASLQHNLQSLTQHVLGELYTAMNFAPWKA